MEIGFQMSSAQTDSQTLTSQTLSGLISSSSSQMSSFQGLIASLPGIASSLMRQRIAQNQPK
jgi:hypothetical protein